MKTETVSTYEQQALDFLAKTKTTFKAEFVAHGYHFDEDKETRDIYQVTLTREGKKPFVFRFGQSIANSGTIDKHYKHSKEFIRNGHMVATKPSDYERKRKAPTAYDVLTCLTKYEQVHLRISALIMVMIQTAEEQK